MNTYDVSGTVLDHRDAERNKAWSLLSEAHRIVQGASVSQSACREASGGTDQVYKRDR